MKLMDFCKFCGKTLKEFCVEKCYSYGYIRQVASGHVRPSPDLADQLEKDTDGLVKRDDLLWPKETKPWMLKKKKKKKKSVRPSRKQKHQTSCQSENRLNGLSQELSS